MKYLRYLRYLLRHKWFVMIECFGRGLYWQGLTHDLSKLFPSELVPYTNFFYGNTQPLNTHGASGVGNPKAPRRDKTGYYKPTDTGDKAFDFAWLLHQKRNRHHWQWWILPEDEGGVKVMEMDEKSRIEMLCDWIGAGKAQGHFSPPNDPMLETRNWYEANGHKMQLHAETRKWVERTIGK
jgi:hypothetical protein